MTSVLSNMKLLLLAGELCTKHVALKTFCISWNFLSLAGRNIHAGTHVRLPVIPEQLSQGCLRWHSRSLTLGFTSSLRCSEGPRRQPCSSPARGTTDLGVITPVVSFLVLSAISPSVSPTCVKSSWKAGDWKWEVNDVYRSLWWGGQMFGDVWPRVYLTAPY